MTNNPNKDLVPEACPVKILIAVHDHHVVVRAATGTVQAVIVDHRENAQSVEVEAVLGTVSKQDFIEAVYDEAAFIVSEKSAEEARRLSAILFKVNE